jgi:hypothetical protein
VVFLSSSRNRIIKLQLGKIIKESWCKIEIGSSSWSGIENKKVKNCKPLNVCHINQEQLVCLFKHVLTNKVFFFFFFFF